eukprot:scaffold9069_cov36-Phaeocystis_antarctica.AAC.2
MPSSPSLCISSTDVCLRVTRHIARRHCAWKTRSHCRQHLGHAPALAPVEKNRGDERLVHGLLGRERDRVGGKEAAAQRAKSPVSIGDPRVDCASRATCSRPGDCSRPGHARRSRPGT